MTKYDFSSYDNFGNDPLRAEQLRLASKIDLDKIRVDHLRGPIGGLGFRSGMWTVKYDGRKWRFFTSVSHASKAEVQAHQVRIAAALYIAGVRSGYVRENPLNRSEG